MSRVVLLLTTVGLIAGLQAVSIASIQSTSAKSVWDGVYTDEQAVKGAEGYKQDCASCHGDALEGIGQGRPLVGREFISNWDRAPLAELFDKIQLTMPADKPGQLSRERTAAILAFVLKSNQFPAGARDLPSRAEDLQAVRFEAERTVK